jgi:hypothetical protein
MKTSLNFISNAESLNLEEKGFIGPFTLLEKEEMSVLLKRCSRYPRMMLPWEKGRHMVVKDMALAAMHPPLLEKIVFLLGQDVLLWGSQIIRQPTSGKHRWHVDVEHTSWPGVTVWLAAKNVVSRESIGIITGSHRFTVTPQELAAQQGLDLRDDAAVEKAAQTIDSSAKLIYLPIEDGQFILFHGRLWHGTKNTSPNPRYSMIFQYTTPASKVRVPKNNHYPNTSWSSTHPPCLLVHGRDMFKVNKTIDAASISKLKSYLSGVSYYLPRNIIGKAQRMLG